MLRDRVRSAAILIPPLLVALWFGEPWIAGVVLLVVLLAAVEAFRLLTAAGHASFPTLGAVFAMVVALGDTVRPVSGGSGLLLIAVGVVLVGVAGLTRPDPREGLSALMTTVFAAVYVGLLGYVSRLADAGPSVDPTAALGWLGAGRAWILILILAVWAYDTAAFFVGRRFGTRHFIPHISPGKTLEGVAGGLVAALIIGALLVAGVGHSPLAGAALGLVIGLAAQAGDLAESMLKRAAGAKESGKLIPGHGGMLDRVDSFLFAAPVAFLCVSALFG
jgi:phosphatidate cytidylyltransferase